MKRQCRPTYAPGAPRRSRKATPPINQTRPNFTPATAICALWAMTTPVPTRLDQKGFEWSVIVHAPLDAIAKELVRIGMLEKVRRPRAGSLWIDAYQLAPLRQPLDSRHSETVKQVIDCMLERPGSRYVKELRAAGVVTKLLGGIRHRDSGRRLECAALFL